MDICSESEFVKIHRDNPSPSQVRNTVGKEIPRIKNRIANSEQPSLELPSTQLAENEESNVPPTATTQTATNWTRPTPTELTNPKMGDTRVIEGQKQVYFLGFGWIDDDDELNESIYCEDMYENGNEIGSMGGAIIGESDGDINKIVGVMD
ncbi:MAG: DUF6550 family protein [Lachnospiraceae bacterium]|nr:DUF6550 family protein [Lachnospiraceae bacterium]